MHKLIANALAAWQDLTPEEQAEVKDFAMPHPEMMRPECLKRFAAAIGLLVLGDSVDLFNEISLRTP